MLALFLLDQLRVFFFPFTAFLPFCSFISLWSRVPRRLRSNLFLYSFICFIFHFEFSSSSDRELYSEQGNCQQLWNGFPLFFAWPSMARAVCQPRGRFPCLREQQLKGLLSTKQCFCLVRTKDLKLQQRHFKIPEEVLSKCISPNKFFKESLQILCIPEVHNDLYLQDKIRRDRKQKYQGSLENWFLFFFFKKGGGFGDFSKETRGLMLADNNVLLRRVVVF